MSSATHKKRVAYEVAKFFRKHVSDRMTHPIRHIYPMAYVVGYAAPRCLVVSMPWPDAEKPLQRDVRNYPLKQVYLFDASLKAGDWCSLGYVSTLGSSETVAIPVVV